MIVNYSASAAFSACLAACFAALASAPASVLAQLPLCSSHADSWHSFEQ